MKAFLCLLVVSMGVSALAQPDLSGTLYCAIEALRKKGFERPVSPQGPNPTEASGFGGLPPKNDSLPPPREFGEDENQVEVVSAPGAIRIIANKIYYTGGVHIRYKGYDIFANEIEGDRLTDIYTARGNVVVVARDQVIQGQEITVNFTNNTYEAVNSDVQLNPTFFPDGYVKDPVYVKDARSSGSSNRIHSHDGGITTCDRDHPHYIILSKNTDIRPTRRIVMRKVSLELLGKKLFTIPYLSIPLDQRIPRYLPEVGQSQDEGYYIKFRYPIDLGSESQFLDARLDYFTKLGNGIGGDYTYYHSSYEGNFNVYTIIGPNQRTVDANLRHLQRIGRMDLSIDTNYQRQNYLVAPENTLFNTRLLLNIPQNNGTTTSIGYLRNTNTSDTFNSINENWSIRDNRNWSRDTRTTLDLSLPTNSTSFTGGVPVERKQLDIRFRGQHDLKKAMAELEYRRSVPIGDTTNFFTQPDLTPVFSLRSDAARLLGRRWADELPFNIETSIGEYTDTFLKDQISRGHIEINAQKPDRRSRRFGVSMDGRYKQTVYSDDTAQYVMGFNGQARYDFSRLTGLNFRYSYLMPHGFAPLQFDRTGETNFTSMDLSFEPVRNLLLGAQTGYDFLLERQQQTAWQSVGVRSEWTPAEWFHLRGLATYDTFEKAWSNIRLDLGWRAGGTFISAGARYDGLRHTWGNLNLFVDGLKWGRLKVSSILNYNGYLKEFEARHFSFTYDLHCAELILQILDNPLGFRPGRQISLFVRLKAFPFDTPFGTGTRGQGFGTGTGYDG